VFDEASAKIYMMERQAVKPIKADEEKEAERGAVRCPCHGFLLHRSRLDYS
jgi:hypothetical protein